MLEMIESTRKVRHAYYYIEKKGGDELTRHKNRIAMRLPKTTVDSDTYLQTQVNNHQRIFYIF